VTKPLSEQELQALLRQSREWNSEHGLTGVLLYSDGDILQVLEGTPYEVNYIFERIQKDCRHHNVTKLADGFIQARNFTDWSMGFISINPDEYQHLTGYLNPLSSDYLRTYSDTDSDSMHSLLSTFVHADPIRL
jgi:hypothetical protein